MLPTARLMNAPFCSTSAVEHLVKALAAALREERSRVDGVASLSTADEESVTSGEEDRKLGPVGRSVRSSQ